MSPTQTDEKARFVEAIAGVTKHVTTPVTLLGVSYTATTLSAIFTNATTALDEERSLKAQLSKQRTARVAAVAEANAVYNALRQSLIAQNGSEPALFEDFGMTLPKPRTVRSAADKAATVQKAQATRAVRHTMGSLQKKKVKGTVEVPASTLAASGTSTSPSSSTAAASTTPSATSAPSTATATASPPTPNASTARPGS